MADQEWFESWFDTPYYHTLYQHRDEQEAERFIRNLLNHLRPSKDARILDLACGKGRHAIFLNRQGFEVTGVDLSAHSIGLAKKHESDSLHFDVHDMREVYHPDAFHYVFNLFTSFGYFNRVEDNIRMIQSVHAMLKNNGTFVIDFLNKHKVTANLVAEETKILDGIEFKIKREIADGFVRKHIAFRVDGKDHSYTEQVQLFEKDDIRNMLEDNGFEVKAVFGDYDLNPFQKEDSARLILKATKK